MSGPLSRRAIRFLGWVTTGLLALLLLSGYGISDFRVVTPLTFGLLDKPTSQQLHEILGVPLIVLLLLHAGASYLSRREGRRPGGGEGSKP